MAGIKLEVEVPESDIDARDGHGCPVGPDGLLIRGIIRRAIGTFEDLGYADPWTSFQDWLEPHFEAVRAELKEDRD